MKTESEFESAYARAIDLNRVLEQVSHDSALYNLYSEYKRLDGDEEKFSELLKDWELDR